MKNIFMTFALVSGLAQAYSTQYMEIKAGQLNVVRTLDNSSSYDSKKVSLSLDVRTKSSQLPMVKSLNLSEKCQFRQVLIRFSGYDRQTSEYIRTYEIQVLADVKSSGSSCRFEIITDQGMPSLQRTQVVVLGR